MSPSALADVEAILQQAGQDEQPDAYARDLIPYAREPEPADAATTLGKAIMGLFEAMKPAPQPAPVIHVAPAQVYVNVQVPEQEPPVVNVAAPEMPEIKIPPTVVNVEAAKIEVPPTVVNVPQAKVENVIHLPEPRPRKIRVERDEDGDATRYVEE